MAALLADGDTQGTYAMSGWKVRSKADQTLKVSTDRSAHGHAVTAAIATACARAGWSFGDLRDVLLGSPAKGGNHVRDIAHRSGHDRAVRYIERVWERARTLVQTSTIASRHDAYADLYALREKAASAAWHGTTGATDLKVLMAHFQAALRAGGRTYTLSCREAAEIAGCTAHTALKSAKRLTRWLRKVDSGTHEHGTTWTLIDGSHQRHIPRGAQPGGARPNVAPVRNGQLDPGTVSSLMALDAFAFRGLGASSVKLLAALRAKDGQTVAELREAASVSQATAYRHLKRLDGHGLVVQVGEVWELTEAACEALSGAWEGWASIAAREGTQGTAQRRRERHSAQRHAWHTIVLPRLRERRMPDVTPVRGDEARPECVWGGMAFDPATGEVTEDLVVAHDGRFLLVIEEPDYDELCRRAREANLLAA